MRVVFLGTPSFAVATLDAIYNSMHKIVGVVTTPDKPAGRGLKLQASEVKNYAISKGIPVLQPQSLKDELFIDTLKSWKADVFVVVAFRMLPQCVYEIPPKGSFNVHASLLPQYRGAAPIHWAIMNGEKKTGVTTFFLNNEIDCGDIILQKETEILPEETTGELYNRLQVMGAELALDTLSVIENNEYQLVKQQFVANETIKLAPKIQKKDTWIDWNLPAKEIINKIRALSPYPGATTFIAKNEKTKVALKIFKATILEEKTENKCGEIATNYKTFLTISTKDFKISIQNLQLEGKKRLDITTFLSGCKMCNYTII